MEPVFNCEHCGATLRVKPASLKFLKTVQCSKCQKKTNVPQALTDAAKNGQLTAAPKADVPETSAATPAPAASPAPPPPPVAAVPAPSPPPQPATPPAPAAPPPTPPAATPAPAPTVPSAPASSADDARVAALETRLAQAEKAISMLQAELAALLGAEAEAAKQRGELLTNALTNLGK